MATIADLPCTWEYVQLWLEREARLGRGAHQGGSQMPHRARRGDPLERGHPSLVELRLCTRFTWIWFPGEGWACGEFGSPECM
jgi:hypothetical protein